eukprot:SAG22_NODE_11323_length_490_cov_0.941176_2_plen_86_part_01
MDQSLSFLQDLAAYLPRERRVPDHPTRQRDELPQACVIAPYLKVRNGRSPGSRVRVQWTLTRDPGLRPSHLETATWVAGSPGNGHP